MEKEVLSAFVSGHRLNVWLSDVECVSPHKLLPFFLSIQFVCFSFNSVAKTPASFRNVLLDELLCKETSLLAKSLPFIKVLKI